MRETGEGEGGGKGKGEEKGREGTPKGWLTPPGPPMFQILKNTLLSLSPKFGLRLKISQKLKSFFFVWTQRFAEHFAETKRRTDRSLKPKLINSLVDFAYTRYVKRLKIKV